MPPVHRKPRRPLQPWQRPWNTLAESQILAAMSLHAELLEEIESGPSGPEIAALFDLDHTLIARFSVFDFLREALASGLMDGSDLAAATSTGLRFQLGQIDFSGFVNEVTGVLAGHSEAAFMETADKIFRERLGPAIYPEARALVNAHRRKGHTLAVVSAATPYQTGNVAHDLRIPNVLCTRLEVHEGKFTGKLVQPTCYGEGKAIHARNLAASEGFDLGQSYFYTDSDEDLPLLDIVGNPRPLNPNRRLTDIALRRGWPARTFTSRSTPTVAEVVRTGLAVGSLVPSFLMALPAAARDGNWRRVVNAATSTWGEVGTALAGIDLQVHGEEHLWSHRPAVFIFNHQSGLDTLLLCKLLRRDMVAIAKQELRANPIFGPAFALAGTVFIDRFDHKRAVDALGPAVQALREGMSIVIAPEGTRMPTPRLGRFKKGAFHIAMSAGVPLVPIVFRNTLDALPKHAYFVRSTTVEVEVLPPVPTTGWKAKDLESHIAAIRAQFETVLGD